MPIQLIWGNDLRACNSEIEKIIKNNISDEWKNLNLSKFNGEDSEQVFKALEEIQTPPLGSGSRIVLLKNNPIFNCKTEDFFRIFEKIHKNIADNCFLILVNSQKPDSRIKTTKLFKELLKHNYAEEFSFNLPDMWDTKGQIDYVEKIANNINLKLEHNAASRIIESIGIDSSKLLNELEKAKLYLSEKNKKSKSDLILKIDDIKELFNEHQSNIFTIIDLILEQDISACLIEIYHLLNKGEPPLRLTAGLISQIRIYTIVLLLMNEKDTNTICKLANITNPKRIFFIKKKVKKCSPHFLINIMIQLLNIESWIKKGNNPIDVFTENLITLT